MDDGAKDLEMSVKMLKMQKNGGIRLSVLTPHYYYDEETVEEFLERRGVAYGELMEGYDPAAMPKTMLGAEVAMYKEMSEDDLTPLCVGNTNLLLVEMPMRFENYITDELSELVCHGFVPLVAHFERYFHTYKEKEIKEIAEVEGCLYQVNIISLEDRKIRDKVFKMAEKGTDFVLGTDAHNISSRPPYIDTSFLEEKRGRTFSKNLFDAEEGLLGIVD